MTSTFPAIFSPADDAPFPEIDPTGFTPWEDLSILFDPNPHDSSEPSTNIYSSSGSISGSSEPVPVRSPDEPVSIIEERKRKRKLSNRLSARRSRMRKLTNLESLVSHVNRLRFENRELTNRFRIANHQLLFTRTENRRLWDECAGLRTRLDHFNQILYFMQLQKY